MHDASMWTCFSISIFACGQARSKIGGVDTSILHHVFLQLFIMFLYIIMLVGVILMPFLSGLHKEGECRELEFWT